MFLYLIASKQRLSGLEPSRKKPFGVLQGTVWFIAGYIV